SRSQIIPSPRRRGDSPTPTWPLRLTLHVRAHSGAPRGGVTVPRHPLRHTGGARESAPHANHFLAQFSTVPSAEHAAQHLLTHAVGYAGRHRGVGTPASYPRAGPRPEGAPAGERQDRTWRCGRFW